MPGNIPGNFGLKKRPATLDFSGIIAKVEWLIGPNILMLHFDVNVQLHEPHAVMVDGLDVSIHDAFDNVVNIHDTFLTPPTPTNPVTKEMVAHTLAWNRAPRKPAAGSDLFYKWKAVLFLNLGRIVSFAHLLSNTYDVVIRIPASEKKAEPSVAYYAFADPFGNSFDYYEAHPTTTGAIIDAEGHTAIVGSPLIFGSIAQRSAFLGYNAGSLPPWVAFDKPGTGDTFDLLDWTLKAYTFKSRKDFKLDDNLDPAFTLDNIGFQLQREHATVDVQIPARTVTVTVNLKTLTMTSKKV
jgi:hypothetical protein